MRKPHYILAGLACFLLFSCSKDFEDHPAANQTPKTFLWLIPDDTLGVGVSRQHLRWWGEDPDGVVKGFLFAFNVTSGEVTSLPNPDTLKYCWVTGNDTLILFPLDTLMRKFTVYVRSVDNTFRDLPNQSIVRFTPTPYWDKNANGTFDAGDEQLSGILQAVDPRGAVQTFPIRNTPPQIIFTSNPFDATRAQKQPDTTFTVASFAWHASDADGDNTLLSYRIALNDTSTPDRWTSIPLRDTLVTLVVRREISDTAGAEVTADVYGGAFLGRRLLGTVPGLRLNAFNRLFVQSRDIAGEYSTAITMPSGAATWYVKRPRPRPSPTARTVLLVSDYITSDSAAAEQTYRSSLANMIGGEHTQVDRLNIGMGLTASVKGDGNRPGSAIGVMVPPFIDPALIQTFLLYDYVLWYTDRFPSLRVAQLSLFPYLQNGGKVIFSTTFAFSVDTRGALRDFAPIDSIRSSLDANGVYGNYRVLADSTNLSNLYPDLAFDTLFIPQATHSVLVRSLYRRSDARYIYHLQADTANITPRYPGTLNVAVVDGQQSIVFVGLPLHLLNNTANGRGLTAFFNKAILEEFSPTHNIDRRKF